MAEYIVLGPNGERYGPATVDVLTQWSKEGRLTPDTMLEEVGTGQRLRPSEVPGIILSTPNWQNPTASYPRGEYVPVKNGMVKSVIATLCCCLPLGVAAIVFSSKVDSLARVGDIAGAEAAAKKANTFANISIILGLIYIVFAFLTGLLGDSGSFR